MTTWTILIATLGQRAQRLKTLLDQLLPQIDKSGNGNVNVCALYNKGERPLGFVRHLLLESTTSDYVSFVDDDDELPNYFVAEVMSRLDGEVDYIGWQMQCILDGRKLKPTYHSLRYNTWAEDRKGFYRDISHINPIKTEIAKLGDFRRGQPPEDVSWVEQVRPFVQTESYIDKNMYTYHASSADSTWRTGARIQKGRMSRCRVQHAHFSYHPESS
jgi:glycosyltransferase involved in cell wall biosynthesis